MALPRKSSHARMNFKQGLPSTATQPASRSVFPSRRVRMPPTWKALPPSLPSLPWRSRRRRRRGSCWADPATAAFPSDWNGWRRQKRPLRSYDDGDGPAPSLIERTAGPPDGRASVRPLRSSSHSISRYQYAHQHERQWGGNGYPHFPSEHGAGANFQ